MIWNWCIKYKMWEENIFSLLFRFTLHITIINNKKNNPQTCQHQHNWYHLFTAVYFSLLRGDNGNSWFSLIRSNATFWWLYLHKAAIILVDDFFFLPPPPHRHLNNSISEAASPPCRRRADWQTHNGCNSWDSMSSGRGDERSVGAGSGEVEKGGRVGARSVIPD